MHDITNKLNVKNRVVNINTKFTESKINKGKNITKKDIKIIKQNINAISERCFYTIWECLLISINVYAS